MELNIYVCVFNKSFLCIYNFPIDRNGKLGLMFVHTKHVNSLQKSKLKEGCRIHYSC